MNQFGIVSARSNGIIHRSLTDEDPYRNKPFDWLLVQYLCFRYRYVLELPPSNDPNNFITRTSFWEYLVDVESIEDPIRERETTDGTVGCYHTWPPAFEWGEQLRLKLAHYGRVFLLGRTEGRDNDLWSYPKQYRYIKNGPLACKFDWKFVHETQIVEAPTVIEEAPGEDVMDHFLNSHLWVMRTARGFRVVYATGGGKAAEGADKLQLFFTIKRKFVAGSNRFRYEHIFGQTGRNSGLKWKRARMERTG